MCAGVEVVWDLILHLFCIQYSKKIFYFLFAQARHVVAMRFAYI